MASHLERCLIGAANQGLKLSSSLSSSSFRVPRRLCYESGGMRYLDLGGPGRVRDPNDPRRAKLPEGPKLGADPNERVPWTYGHVKPHYHVFKQLWPEPTLLKRKFGPKAESAQEIPQPVDHVEVPLRKARSPTAVLEALSSTVCIDAHTVPYDLLDDPYLLPVIKPQLDIYRGARASGRRVAKRIAEDLPHFFDYKFFRPDPIIEALESGKSDWDNEISEDGAPEFDEIINERLLAGRYDLAFKAYETSLEHQAQLSPGVMASLFEVAAWNNLTLDSDFDALRPSEAPEPEETNNLNDYTLFKSMNATRENLWEADGIAEDLWRRIPKTDALHCIFIRALVRHGDTRRAYEHFQTMLAEDKVVDLPTFNSLLTWHNEIDTERQSSEDGKNMIYPKILNSMAERGVRPTTATFNAVLHGLTDKRLPSRRDQAESTVIEMIDLNLRPTFDTLTFLIKTWRLNANASRLLTRQVDWLLKILESGDVESSAEDDHDHSFFPLAVNLLTMEQLRFSPEVPDLVLRIHELVRVRSNYRAVATKNNFSFRAFLKCSVEALLLNGFVDEAMRLFTNYVPNFVTFTNRDWYHVMNHVSNAAPIPVRHVVTLGNELSSPAIIGDRQVSDLFVSLLTPHAAKDPLELQTLVAVAANYFRGYLRVQELADKSSDYNASMLLGPEKPGREYFRLSGYAYGNIILILAHGENLDDAIRAFDHYSKEQDRIVGTPPVEAVALLMRRAAKSSTLTNSRKGQVMVNALKFLDEVGAKLHLAQGLDLMIEEVSLDAQSALIVAELKKELEGRERKSPERSTQS